MESIVSSSVFFYFFSAIAIASALMVVIKKNPVTCAFNLVVVFFSVAALYALMGAHLVATLQVLVYAGAVMVLFIFVIMLLGADSPSLDLGKSGLALKGFVGIAFFGLLFFFVRILSHPLPKEISGLFTLSSIKASGGNTRVISEVLFSDYILPFELIAVLLLASMVGVVAIALRKSRMEGLKK